MKKFDGAESPTEGTALPAEIPTAPAVDLSQFTVLYEGDLMRPQSVTLRRADGSSLRSVRRVVIEVVQDRLPSVLELEP